MIRWILVVVPLLWGHAVCNSEKLHHQHKFMLRPEYKDKSRWYFCFDFGPGDHPGPGAGVGDSYVYLKKEERDSSVVLKNHNYCLRLLNLKF